MSGMHPEGMGTKLSIIATVAIVLALPANAPCVASRPQHNVDPIDIGRYHAAARLCVNFAKQLKPSRRKLKRFLEDCYVSGLPRA